jgi:hypothetical protein
MIPFGLLLGVMKVLNPFAIFNLTDGHIVIFLDRAISRDEGRASGYEFHNTMGQYGRGRIVRRRAFPLHDGRFHPHSYEVQPGVLFGGVEKGVQHLYNGKVSAKRTGLQVCLDPVVKDIFPRSSSNMFPVGFLIHNTLIDTITS